MDSLKQSQSQSQICNVDSRAKNKKADGTLHLHRPPLAFSHDLTYVLPSLVDLTESFARLSLLDPYIHIIVAIGKRNFNEKLAIFWLNEK